MQGNPRKVQIILLTENVPGPALRLKFSFKTNLIEPFVCEMVLICNSMTAPIFNRSLNSHMKQAGMEEGTGVRTSPYATKSGSVYEGIGACQRI